MIRLENKETTIKKDEESNMTYSDLAIAVTNQESPKGFSVTDMKKRFRIIEALESSKKDIELEDEDFNNLKTLVNDMKWGMPHKDIVAFTDDINELEVK